MKSTGLPFMLKMLVIDNYDSFTYNLVQMFRFFPLDITVRRNDRVTLEEIELLSPDYLVISPGPGRPSEGPACPWIYGRSSITPRRRTWTYRS